MTARMNYFGTDGIRGTVNQEPITPQTILRLAMAAGTRFRRGDYRHRAVIGKDTRLSGYMLEPALTAGFIATGMDVILAGPLPTPAISMLVPSLRADVGVMISASHNPYWDNGIKLFGPDGRKLSSAVQHEIEDLMNDQEGPAVQDLSTDTGRASRLDDAPGRYIEMVKNTLPADLRLDGLKIIIDCANGAAYRVAPTVLYELGGEIISLGDAPDGLNINQECGAVDPEAMRQKVLDEGADIGIALDGDADRVILADEKGALVDGDQILALIAEAWHGTGRLNGNAVVGTVMSNLGLENRLRDLGLGLVRTAVGDHHVIESMVAQGYNVGGEQSGHIVLNDFITTGDGLIAALQVLAVLVRNGRPASEICRCFEPMPQILRNVPVTSNDPLATLAVREAMRSGEKKLGDTGRLLVRPSGTEPVIRIMAEGPDSTLIAGVVDDIAAALEQGARS